MVKKISENEFQEVKEAKAALIDFSASWCGPCKMLAPVLEEVAEEMKDSVSFYNVDVDDNPDLAGEFGVTNIPALVLLKEGKIIDMKVGFQPKEGIVNFMKANF